MAAMEIKVLSNGCFSKINGYEFFWRSDASLCDWNGNTPESQTEARSVNAEPCTVLAHFNHAEEIYLSAKQPSLWAHWTVYRKSFSRAHFKHQSSHEQLPAHKRQKRDLLTWPKFRCYKLMPGNKTSPHVQIFMKLMLHLPPWKSVQSCATIDHSQEHAAMLNVLSLMHPWGAHSDKRFSRVARHRGVSLKVQRKSLA